MKKLIFLSSMLLIAFLLTACGSVVRGSGEVIREDRQVSDFSKVSLSGMGEVVLIQGDEESLTIEAEDNLLRYLSSEVRGETLELSIRPWDVRIWPSQPIKYYLTVKNIDALSVSASGDISVDELETDALTLTVSGSGEIQMDKLEVTSLDASISGSGNVYLDQLSAEEVSASISGSGECYLIGESRSQTISIYGSGKYYASDLESELATAEISGSGDAWVTVSENLDVRVSGSGNISYYGRPAINQSVSGSGDIVNLGIAKH